MILKRLIENSDSSPDKPKVLLALNGLVRLYETLTSIQEPKALLTCKDCLVDLDWVYNGGIFIKIQLFSYHPTNKKPHECGNHYKCNFIPIWLSLNPNAL